MPRNDPRIQKLIERLDFLQKKQELFRDEIQELRREIRQLQQEGQKMSTGEFRQADAEPEETPVPAQTPDRSDTGRSRVGSFITRDLEKFIGENLINKIGILITIIGVAIGAQYAIDHELISPVMRIVLGYLLGGVLVFFAVRLRESIPNFSAVLFSGAMAIFYIVTFAAHSLYSIFGIIPAFLLMVLTTLATVAAALHYKRVAVAHIGLVGAYAVPFLVGSSGPVYTLFIYMSIINTGVLAVGIYKYWNSLTYSAFAFTWLIFGSWYSFEYLYEDHFSTALIFSLIFFLIFYLSSLIYKITREQTFRRSDVWLILANAFIFYGFGFSVLNGHESTMNWLGFFTAGNALIHFVAALWIYRAGLTDKNLFYLAAGLTVTFLTIAVPVELDGSWVTMLWIAEAAILFWIGRSQGVGFYAKMAHPLLPLAFISLLIDWNGVYPLYEMENSVNNFSAIFNIHFFTSLFFITGVSLIAWKDYRSDELPRLYKNRSTDSLMRWMTVLILVLAAYFAFRLEIQGFFHKAYINSSPAVDIPAGSGNTDLLRFSTIWVFNYSMLFISALIFAAVRWFRSKEILYILFAATVVCTFLFLGDGLSVLAHLKDRYLHPPDQSASQAGIYYVAVRYVCFLFLGMMLFAAGRMCRRGPAAKKILISYEALLYIAILWVLSSELILWLDISGTVQPYKLGITILWGVYSLAVIAIGIKTNKKHLRIGAIVLIGITLIKLFFYDITDLDAIARTIVFVTLGVLLLLASYLYNKFKVEIQKDQSG